MEKHANLGILLHGFPHHYIAGPFMLSMSGVCMRLLSDLIDSGVELIHVSKGSFLMGSLAEFFGETPKRTVTLKHDFWLGKYLVTQAQWVAVMGNNPSQNRHSHNLPVVNVSWHAAVEFCERLSEDNHFVVRLPTEAEWEYACRAGRDDDFHFGRWGTFGDSSEIPAALMHELQEYAWFDRNSQGQSQIIGQKLPNVWGFHDMIGNVWEWCQDSWHDDYSGAPTDGIAWESGATSNSPRVLRGGAWDMDAFRCRSTYRSYDRPDQSIDRIGLRITVSNRKREN